MSNEMDPVGGTVPLNEEIQLGEKGVKIINDLNKKAALAGMNMLKRALSTASEPLLRRGLGERYFNPGARDGATMIWVLATIASGYVAASGAGTIAGWLFWHAHLSAVSRFFDLWYFPALSGFAFIFYYYRLCKDNADYLRQFRDKGIPYHSMSRGEARWNAETIKPLLAILAGLLLFNIFVFIALVIAKAMAMKIANEQQEVIRSRYLDSIDEKLENECMKEALLGRAKAAHSYLARPLSEKEYTPEVREQVADAWVGRNVAVVARPRRSATPGKNPAQTSPTGGREGESSPVPSVGTTFTEEKEEPDPAVQVQPFSIPKVDPKTIKRAAILAAGVLAIYVVCHLCSFMWREIHGYLARRPAANSPVAVSSAPKESPTVVQSQPRQQSRVEQPPAATPAGNSKPENTPVESTLAQNTPRASAEPNTPVGSTPSQNTPQEVVQAKQPTATQSTPPAAVPESSQGKMAEAIKSLNTFSNYCYTTLSTDHGLIEKISDQRAHDRLERVSQAVEQSISKMIARQQQYLDQLTPGPDADASIERSTPKLVSNRSSETNNLDQLNLAIQQAMSRN